jgi:histidyl-tRNA synthetase
LVRGLDYYTRTVFEVSSKSLGAQKQLSGGGRYDRLVEDCGGPPTPAVGFGAGLERIALLTSAPVNQRAPQIFVAAVDDGQRDLAFRTVADLRRRGLAADSDFADKGLASQLKQAHRLGCSFALIIGEEEQAAGQFTLRDMQTGEQRRLNLDSILAEVLNAGK